MSEPAVLQRDSSSECPQWDGVLVAHRSDQVTSTQFTGFPRSLITLPSPSLLLLGITCQINACHPYPYFWLCFEGSQIKTVIQCWEPKRTTSWSEQCLFLLIPRVLTEQTWLVLRGLAGTQVVFKHM